MFERGEATDPGAIAAAAAHLAVGRVVVLPTDTVYGLAALPSVEGATDAVFAAKGRPVDVPLAVLVDSLDQALALVDEPSDAAARLVARYWPGPLTVVLRRRPDVDVDLGGEGGTVGVRCPDHHLVRALARQLGPLVVTSANRHGEPTPITVDGVAAALGDAVTFYLDGGPCDGVASTVVDGTRDDLPILRAGPISPEAIARIALR